MNIADIICSGDLELIGSSLDEKTILEHFGRESFEYLAYEHSLADDYLSEQKNEKKYIIPTRGEDPSVTKGMLKNWIREFCKVNKLELPEGFHSKTSNQLIGMYTGMLKNYKLKLEEIVPHLKYRI